MNALAYGFLATSYDDPTASSVMVHRHRKKVKESGETPTPSSELADAKEENVAETVAAKEEQDVDMRTS